MEHIIKFPIQAPCSHFLSFHFLVLLLWNSAIVPHKVTNWIFLKKKKKRKNPEIYFTKRGLESFYFFGVNELKNQVFVSSKMAMNSLLLGSFNTPLLPSGFFFPQLSPFVDIFLDIGFNYLFFFFLKGRVLLGWWVCIALCSFGYNFFNGFGCLKLEWAIATFCLFLFP